MSNLCVGSAAAVPGTLKANDGLEEKSTVLKCSFTQNGKSFACEIPLAVIKSITSYLGSNESTRVKPSFNLQIKEFVFLAPGKSGEEEAKINDALPETEVEEIDVRTSTFDGVEEPKGKEESKMAASASDATFEGEALDLSSGRGAGCGMGAFEEMSARTGVLAESIFTCPIPDSTRPAFDVSNSFNLVNKAFRNARSHVICEILQSANKHPEIAKIIAELEVEISSNLLMPGIIKKSEQYLLHCLMDVLTSTAELEVKHYSKGIHGIYSADQVLAAYNDFKVLDDKSFLKCIDHLRGRGLFRNENGEPLPSSLKGVSEIKRWFQENPTSIKVWSHLDLYNLDLKVIPRGFFSLFPNHTWIDLESNNISKVSSYMFCGGFCLKFLSLDGNNIKKIPKNAFLTLQQLETLSLQGNGNGISKISLGAFKDLVSLKTLYIQFEGISFPLGIFDTLANLENLTFISKKIWKLPANCLESSRLKKLSLQLSRLTSVSNNCLRGLPNIIDFSLRGGLSSDEQPLRTIPGELFSHTRQLTHITISTMGLKEFPPELFLGLPDLERLDLRRNKIRLVHSGQFRDVKEDCQVILQSNCLRVLPDDLSSKPRFDLLCNRLPKLPRTILQNAHRKSHTISSEYLRGESFVMMVIIARRWYGTQRSYDKVINEIWEKSPLAVYGKTKAQFKKEIAIRFRTIQGTPGVSRAALAGHELLEREVMKQSVSEVYLENLDGIRAKLNELLPNSYRKLFEMLKVHVTPTMMGAYLGAYMPENRSWRLAYAKAWEKLLKKIGSKYRRGSSDVISGIGREVIVNGFYETLNELYFDRSWITDAARETGQLRR